MVLITSISPNLFANKSFSTDSIGAHAAEDNLAEYLTVNGPQGTLNFSVNDLKDMPQNKVLACLTCYGSLIAEGEWTGVNLRYLVSQAGIDPNTNTLLFHALDGYQVIIPLGATVREDTIVAYALDGKPLDEWTRLVLPEDNGENWISMITSISQTHTDPTPKPTVELSSPKPNNQSEQKPSQIPLKTTGPQITPASKIEPTPTSQLEEATENQTGEPREENSKTTPLLTMQLQNNYQKNEPLHIMIIALALALATGGGVLSTSFKRKKTSKIKEQSQNTSLLNNA